MTTPDTDNRRRPQFSLRSILILMIGFGIAASMWISFRANRESLLLRQENIRLRNAIGELTIEPGQEDKVHAIAVEELEARTWKWRVYIPDGRPFGLQVQTKEQNGSGSSWSLLSPGECTVVVALRHDLNDHWEWIIRERSDHGSGESRHTASPNVERLIMNPSALPSGVHDATQSAEPGADLDLLKYEMAGANLPESVSVTIHDGPH
jgi:hypothetical protein